MADARKGPFAFEFKRTIEEARGNPTAHLDDYLAETAKIFQEAKSDTSTGSHDLADPEDELRDQLAAAHNTQHIEQLSSDTRSKLIETYRNTTGQLTPFDAPLEAYAKGRKVEAKTAAKDRHAITKFAARVKSIQAVDQKAVLEFVKHLSEEEGVKNRTIKDNLSTLRTYWKWLQDMSVVRVFGPRAV